MNLLIESGRKKKKAIAMNDYIEYTIWLIVIPSHILARLSLYDLNINRTSLKGFLLHLAFFALYSAIIAAYVFFIRSIGS